MAVLIAAWSISSCGGSGDTDRAHLEAQKRDSLLRDSLRRVRVADSLAREKFIADSLERQEAMMLRYPTIRMIVSGVESSQPDAYLFSTPDEIARQAARRGYAEIEAGHYVFNPEGTPTVDIMLETDFAGPVDDEGNPVERLVSVTLTFTDEESASDFCRDWINTGSKIRMTQQGNVLKFVALP